MLNWNRLDSEEQLDDIIRESDNKLVMIFKHSTTCSISAATKSRLERHWNQNEVGSLKAYYLDLLQYRDISDRIEQQFRVPHESPQVLVIKKGKIIYDESHLGISFEDLKTAF